MILVADSSALVALSICGELELLEQLFGVVKVPAAVFHEVTVGNKAESDALKEFLEGKVEVVDTSNFVYLDGYADLGETEAMLLYKQLSADWLLIDDRHGRQVAGINQIQIVGSLGVLLKAKQRGLITALKPKLDLLINSKIYISAELQRTILELAGEC